MHPIHKSGATKRKQRHLRDEQQKEEKSKLPKLDTFFNLQSQSQELSAEDYELSTLTSSIVSLGDSFVSNSSELLAVVDSSFIESEDQVPEVAEEQHTFTEKEIQLVNDIGLWDDISENIRNRWIAKGSEDCRNNCNNCPNSGMIHGNEGYRRYCSKSFFTRVHPLTGEFAERIWLCYSPLRGKVLCFACKLLTRISSSFTQGFNDWKHADDRISSHENSQQHREVMVIMCTRKTSIGSVDCHVIQEFENQRQYWRKVIE